MIAYLPHRSQLAAVRLVTVYSHGLSGAGKSNLRTAIFLFFAVCGGSHHSLDARLKKTF
ncbi:MULTISPECIES: hypothetical protein [Alphaproteobacteria]|uniref:Uncharacterized protein n=2 Tax=Alphaproteobacteria TaxID=28211 RepID=A0A512HE92_9HYPH|nr:hypothetical protein [Sphingomonas psychrolutea]GEO83769.1 hypothetical protein RNA01_07010 [Ciceribacter naphthalenivorans]GLR24079.1 hypothetical protein GCM10007920_38730 [Ciceribacter naphthalenivorans]GLT06935.1 hypothetical protein GCM10007926_38730 [Sphingomonas psychrolutea]